MGEPGVDASDLELQRCRRLLTTAQQFGRFGVWERDMATGVGHWEPQLFQLFGLPVAAQAPDYERVMEVLAGPTRDQVYRVFHASVTQPGRHELRYSVQHADGRVVWLHSIWQVPTSGTLIQGVIIDETEAVLLLQQHQIARTQLDMMGKLAGMSVWRTDLATQRMFRGEQIWHATGLDPGPAGIPVAELRQLIHPDDLAMTDRASQAALASDSSADVETRFRTPEGGWKTMLTRRIAQRDDAGQPVAMLGVGFDITEQVEARERYKRLVEQFEMVVEAAGIGLWTVDVDRGEQQWNAEMFRLYGLPITGPMPAIQADGMVDAVLSEDRPTLVAAMHRVMLPEAPQAEASWRIRRPDGEVRTLVGRARRLGGPGVVIAGVAIDVTELRQAEQAHRDRDRAEQANRAKSEFLSQMNHELRTPLNAVLGFSQLLLLEQAGSLTPQQRRQVQHIEAAGAHLLALISDALDHERIEARRPALSLEAVTLAPLLQESLAMVRTQALERNITLLPPAVGDPACQLWADRTRLLQVLINLLTNAIKYNRPGGTVALQVQRDPAQDQACVQVLDTGLGMRQDQLEQLFQPFNRLGREHSLVEGSGIGLALSRQLVQEMGGRIEVSSTSAGSVFQVWLPVASPA